MKSSAQLQREAQVQRAQLSSTLDRLGDSLQPTALTNEAVTLAKDSGLSLAKTLAESARAHPVPALLIGAGLTMLLTRGDSHSGSSGGSSGTDLFSKAADMLKSVMSSGSSTVRHTAESARETAGSVRDSVSETAASVRDRVSETAGSVRDKVTGAVTGAYDSATHAAEDTAHKATERFGSLRDSATQTIQGGVDHARRALHDGEDKARQLAEQGRRQAEEGWQAIEKLAHEQPILMAALGAAIGAVAGSLFPVTETEKKYMGEMGAKATSLGRDTIARVADVVKTETLGESPEKQVAAVADKLISTVTKDIARPVA